MKNVVLGPYRTIETSLCNLLINRQENNPLSPVAIIANGTSLKQRLEYCISKKIGNIANVHFFDLLEFAKESFFLHAKNEQFLPRYFQKIIIEKALHKISSNSYFSNVSNVKSIANVVLNSIILLKKAQLSQEIFSNLSKDNQKWHDVSLVYSEYEKLLQQHQLIDTEDILKNINLNFSKQFSCMCLYGFYSHNPIEKHCISSLFIHPQIFSYIPFRQHPHYELVRSCIDWYYQNGFQVTQETSTTKDKDIVWQLYEKKKTALTVAPFANEIEEMDNIVALCNEKTAILLPKHEVYYHGIRNTFEEQNMSFSVQEEELSSDPRIQLALALLSVFEEKYALKSLQNLIYQANFYHEQISEQGFEINWELLITEKESSEIIHLQSIISYLKNKEIELQKYSDIASFVRAFLSIIKDISKIKEVPSIFFEIMQCQFISPTCVQLQEVLVTAIESSFPTASNLENTVVGTWENLIGGEYTQLIIPGATTSYFSGIESATTVFSEEEQRKLNIANFSKREREKLLMCLLFDSSKTALFSYPKREFLLGKEQHVCSLLVSILRVEMDIFLDLNTSKYMQHTKSKAINTVFEYDLFLLKEATEKKDAGALAVLFSLYPEWKKVIHSLREKWGKNTFGKYDGIISPSNFPEIMEKISPTQMTEVYPSFIENYARCPFQFFLKKALQLKPPKNESFFQISDYDRKKILLSVVKKYKSSSESNLQKMIEESVDKYLKKIPLKHSLVLRVEKMRLLHSIKNYIHKSVSTENTESYFFVSYGSDEVTITIDSERKIRFTGILDQVDTSQKGSYGIQYIMRKAPQRKNNCLYGGQQIQLPIELAALKKCMHDIPVIQSEYRYVQEGGSYKQIYFTSKENSLDAVQKICHFVSYGIENGFFMPIPDQQKCRSCKFIKICGSYRDILHRFKQNDSHIDFFNILSSIDK